MFDAPREYLKENYEKLMNTPGRISDVAAGFAIGVFISFLPLIGLHMALTVAIAFLLRKSMGAGIIGTLVFNPLSAPIILMTNIKLGRLILGAKQQSITVTVNADLTGIQKLWETSIGVFQPYMIGGLILGSIASAVSFFMVKRSLGTYRERIYLRKRKGHGSNQETAS